MSRIPLRHDAEATQWWQAYCAAINGCTYIASAKHMHGIEMADMAIEEYRRRTDHLRAEGKR